MRRKLVPLLVAFAVLALVLAFFVFNSASGKGDADDELATTTGKFHQLVSSEVFPSEKNAQLLEGQSEEFQKYLSVLRKGFARTTQESKEYSRDQWQSESGSTIESLKRAAREHGVFLPPDNMGFCFGFERYLLSGDIPDAKNLPRLFPQLHAIDSLCRTLFESRIAALVSVQRECFDAPSAAAVSDDGENTRRRGRRGRQEEETDLAAAEEALKPFTDPDNLFVREHFTFVFRASDEAIWAALDRFAQQDEPFVVVTRLDIQNADRPAIKDVRAGETPPPPPGPGMGWGAPGPDPEKPADAPPPRHLRKVAGDSIPVVMLELDVYSFRPPETDNADDSSDPNSQDDQESVQ